MFRLPDYEVIVHIWYNDFGKKLENDILSEASSYELDESTEYQGVDFPQKSRHVQAQSLRSCFS